MTQSPGSAPRTVVITGASSGIGAALSRHLAGEKNNLALLARRADRLAATGRACRELGAAVAEVVGDATSRSASFALRDAALARFGRIDAWINNAGRGIARLVEELSDEELDAMMSVNVKSALYGIQAVLPYFKQRGSGTIVNVASILGRVPYVFRGGYCAAKHALLALSGCLRQELAAEGFSDIRIVSVLPGPVATEFAEALEGDRPTRNPMDEVRRRFLGNPDYAAWLAVQNPEEVAGIIAHLLDDSRPEVYTSEGLRQHALRYCEDAAGREAHMRPVAEIIFAAMKRSE